MVGFRGRCLGRALVLAGAAVALAGCYQSHLVEPAGSDAGLPPADAGTHPAPDAGSPDAGPPPDTCAPGGRWLWCGHYGGAPAQRGPDVATLPSGVSAIGGSMRPLSNFGTPPVGTDDYSQDIVVALQESTFEWRWAKRFGGSDFQEIANIAIEPDESVVVAGTFVGALDFGGGTFTTEFDTDMFLAKLDANGSHVWSRSFGNDSFNTAHGMATGPSGEIVMVGQIGQFPLDLGGGPLTPDYGGDAFVARYDASGAQQWSHLYGDEYTQRAVAVAIQSYGDLSGQVVVAGEFSGGLDFDSGSLVSPNGFDIFIVCFDSAGVPLWSRSYGGDGQQYVTTLAVDPASGRIAVVGTFDGTIDFGGGTLTGTTHYEPYIAVF